MEVAGAVERDAAVGAGVGFARDFVLAGVAVDLDTHEFFLNVEAERRINDRLSAELRVRSFMNSAPGQSLYAFEQDDYVQIRLNWFY